MEEKALNKAKYFSSVLKKDFKQFHNLYFYIESKHYEIQIDLKYCEVKFISKMNDATLLNFLKKLVD